MADCIFASEVLPATPPLRKRNSLSQFLSIKKSPGLTLIELMVAICIVSILAAFATVSFKPLWDKHRLRLAVGDMNGFVQLLRMKAILKKSTFQMKLVDDDLYFRKKNEESWDKWSKRELRESTQYSMTGTSSFYGKGFASPKTITLTVNNYRQKIIININGRTRTSKIY